MLRLDKGYYMYMQINLLYSKVFLDKTSLEGRKACERVAHAQLLRKPNQKDFRDACLLNGIRWSCSAIFVTVTPLFFQNFITHITMLFGKFLLNPCILLAFLIDKRQNLR